MALNLGWILESPTELFIKRQSPGHTTDQLNQNSWGWNPGISTFLNSPHDPNMYIRLRTSVLKLLTKYISQWDDKRRAYSETACERSKMWGIIFELINTFRLIEIQR